MSDTASQPTRPTPTLVPRVAEIFRQLWVSLFCSNLGVGASVMVCSPDRGEGASTVACGLALAGSSPPGAGGVCVVDFNLHRPTLHEMLGAQRSPGVAEIVLEGLDPSAVQTRINEGLDLIPAGDTDGRALEIVRSQALGGMFARLGERYDQVLVDAAAVNQFSEAQVLAGLVGDAVLVVRSDETSREAAAVAKRRLETGGGKLAGIVLNKRTYPIPSFLYRRT